MGDHAERNLVVVSTVVCTGVSGISYNYFSAEPGSTWLQVAANYVFTKWTPNGWPIFYAGETDNAANRLSNHERWQEAVTKYGATHILTHQAVSEADRKREEADLIAAYNPPMNVQLRTTELAGLGAFPASLLGLAGAGRGGKR